MFFLSLSLSRQQTVSLYDPSLYHRAYPVHRAGPDHLSIPSRSRRPPPHPRRVIGTRPQPPPLFNTPASTYSTPATRELPPYIHQRGCIQPLPLSFRYHPLVAGPSDPLLPLPLSLSPSTAASLVTRGHSISLWRAPLSFPFAPFVCLRVVLPFRVNVNGARRVIHRSSTYSCPRLVHPPETATKTAGPLSSARRVWTRKPPPRRRRGRGRGRTGAHT